MPYSGDAGLSQLVRRCKSGDSKALDALIARYYPHIRRCCRGFRFAGAEPEDVMQEALIGFCRAARDFDPDGEIPFDAYTAICIRRHLIDAAKSASREKHKPLNSYVSLNTTADSSSDHAFPVFGFETTFDPSDAIIDREAVRLTSGRINAALSPYERQVLRQYLEGKSYKVIALSAGKSIKSVDNAVSRIRRKLSALLSQDSVK
ncbi:RNA polymerase sigma-H factor [bioreactor metagenome]|uniref:RNA polymerase sigma factor SigS n=1 Tax=bioreactor metagenome TaxID=1076179 RepID=A0A644XDE1_9ZZZZ